MIVGADPECQADQDQARRRPRGRVLAWIGCLVLVVLLVAGLGVQVLGTAWVPGGSRPDAAIAGQPAASVVPNAQDAATLPIQAPDGSRWIYLASYPTNGLVQERPLGVDRAMADDPVRVEGEPDQADEPPLVSRVGPGRPPAGAD